MTIECFYVDEKKQARQRHALYVQSLYITADVLEELQREGVLVPTLLIKLIKRKAREADFIPHPGDM